ncbi:hypothetical protein BpHYR1_016979 [Brachionus plicatilis]|uniref:Uncharacterized protein n=1 Tax=Brachionus plicatilis TaxID=10195 RepID=A0A3M7Q6G6_BRAPC|nr:hypothetical protein BpHYR1_016979 [Brachionus plicatilis]
MKFDLCLMFEVFWSKTYSTDLTRGFYVNLRLLESGFDNFIFSYFKILKKNKFKKSRTVNDLPFSKE